MLRGSFLRRINFPSWFETRWIAMDLVASINNVTKTSIMSILDKTSHTEHSQRLGMHMHQHQTEKKFLQNVDYLHDSEYCIPQIKMVEKFS
ncbi:hypothetical protein YC2023_106523 [Brassica napus]